MSAESLVSVLSWYPRFLGVQIPWLPRCLEVLRCLSCPGVWWFLGDLGVWRFPGIPYVWRFLDVLGVWFPGIPCVWRFLCILGVWRFPGVRHILSILGVWRFLGVLDVCRLTGVHQQVFSHMKTGLWRWKFLLLSATTFQKVGTINEDGWRCWDTKKSLDTP